MNGLRDILKYLKEVNYIRVIMLKLSCIASHLWLDHFMTDISV